MGKVVHINRSFDEAAASRAILSVLRPQHAPYDGPFLRRDLKAASKAGQSFDVALARLLRARFVDELRVVTYEIAIGKLLDDPVPEDLSLEQLHIIDVLRLMGGQCMWYDINSIFESKVPYSDMLKLVSRGIVKSRMGEAYMRNRHVRTA